VIKPISKEDKRAWEILKPTTRHDGVQYESGLLWKVDDPNLPNNSFAAQRRFFNLETKLIKDKGLAAIYKSVVDTYVNLKHAWKLTKAYIDAGPDERTRYCPHHPVFNLNKRGKCRVVFDLLAEYKGVWLNHMLMRGPDLLQITCHFYIDNWLVSFPAADEAISTAKRLTEALKLGGFLLTQWATSDDQVKSAHIGQQKETSLKMDFDAEPIERTLGLVWDFHRDVFVLGAKVEADGNSKRDIMKSIFSIFPLAFLAPIICLAMVFMQVIWRRTIKRWRCIFTRLSTSCVHLEMAYLLDTSYFISLLDHFQNRHEEFLTQNHLLLGRAFPNLPLYVFTEKDLSAKQKWRVAQALAEQFWRRWMKEVIPNLNERGKWQQQQPNLEVGDIVVIIDSSSPRGV
jgi:hypothetical protein